MAVNSHVTHEPNMSGPHEIGQEVGGCYTFGGRRRQEEEQEEEQYEAEGSMLQHGKSRNTHKKRQHATHIT